MGSASSSTPDQLRDLDQDSITLCLNVFIKENDETKLEYLLSSCHVPGTRLTTCPELFHSTILFWAVTFHQMHLYTMSLNSHNIFMKELFLWFPFCRREDWETTFLEQGSPIVGDRAKIWTQSSLITKPMFMASYIPYWPWSGWL